MATNPWMKFYPQDWVGESSLRACSIAARGLWMEMIALAHQASPYGHVLINGTSPDIAMLSRIAGIAESECESLVAELERNGVFSRTRKGVIYSRRMVDDAKKAKHARNIGKRGGNPSLSGKTENQTQDNPPDKPPDKTQKPEARSQRPEVEREEEESENKAAQEPRDKPPDPARQLVDVFDAELASAFGDKQKRAWPAGDDHVMARRWLEAGLDPEDFKFLCQSRMRKKARNGDKPPSCLKYLDTAVQDLIRTGQLESSDRPDWRTKPRTKSQIAG